VCTCKKICETSARKSRNQCKHQQLRVDFLSRSQFCSANGLKKASPRALKCELGRALSKFSEESMVGEWHSSVGKGLWDGEIPQWPVGCALWDRIGG